MILGKLAQATKSLTLPWGLTTISPQEIRNINNGDNLLDKMALPSNIISMHAWFI
jgi:hypothetical protein